MKLLNGNYSFNFYRYRIKEFYLILPGETVTIEEHQVNQITLIDDYMLNLYPILKVDLGLTPDTYHKIIDKKDDVQFRINIQSYYLNSNKKSIYSKSLNGTFSLILDDDDEDMKENYREEYPNGDETEMNAMTTTSEFFLFKPIVTDKEVNIVAKDCTVDTGISYLFSLMGIKNMLGQKSDNTRSYGQFIVPPMKLGNALQWIDSYYGIYKTGSIIYLGLDTSYMIPYGGNVKVFKANEPKVISIIVPEEDGGENNHICQAVKKGESNNCYMIAAPSTFKPLNPTESSKVFSSEEVSVVNPNTGYPVNNAGTKTVTDKSENPFLNSMNKALFNSDNSVVTVLLENINFELLTPNKEYQFLFEDTTLAQKYKGRYFLCKRDILISKESQNMKVSVQCMFKQSLENQTVSKANAEKKGKASKKKSAKKKISTKLKSGSSNKKASSTVKETGQKKIVSVKNSVKGKEESFTEKQKKEAFIKKKTAEMRALGFTEGQIKEVIKSVEKSFQPLTKKEKKKKKLVSVKLERAKLSSDEMKEQIEKLSNIEKERLTKIGYTKHQVSSKIKDFIKDKRADFELLGQEEIDETELGYPDWDDEFEPNNDYSDIFDGDYSDDSEEEPDEPSEPIDKDPEEE